MVGTYWHEYVVHVHAPRNTMVDTHTMVFWLSHTIYHGRESWPYHGVQSTMVFWQLATRHLVF